MTTLKSKPSLKDIQEHILKSGVQLGFDKLNALQRCLMLGEEVGELFKSVRNHERIKIENNAKIDPIENELADVLMHVCAIANYFNIDLEKAFRHKEENDLGRSWK